MAIHWRRLALMMAVAWTGVPPSHANDSVVRTSVCAIIRKPSDFNGKRVQFSAHFESDGMDNSLLTSAECNFGISPFEATAHQNMSELAALESALERGMVGTLDKSITAVFVGIFEFSPQARHPRVLRIERVMSLKVIPKRR